MKPIRERPDRGFDVIYKNRFIWSRKKNGQNRKNHKISFETAADVFDDPFAVQEFDEEHSEEEDRYNVTGRVDKKWVVVTVTWTPRAELIRIISAREADIEEEDKYHDAIKKIIG